MNKAILQEHRDWIRGELKTSLDFWLNNGLDRDNGGMYTCLDREGRVYSTDKSVWMQGRAGWIFSYLCHVYGAKTEWLGAADSCIEFLEKYCRNPKAKNRLYFTVTEDGQPLRQRRYYFSEAFYAMANAEYYGVTGDEENLKRARWAYDLYWDLSHGGDDPVGMGPKSLRKGRAFGPPMIGLNVNSIMLRVDPERKALYEKRGRAFVEDIFKYHVHPELKCLLENVDEDGSPRLFYTEGRTVNPGHDIEGAWFLLEYARHTGDAELVQKAAQIFDWAIEAGWDEKYGGLLYFVDCMGKPPEAYEHDMKLWWPHNEIMITSLMLYRDTGNEKYLDWFNKVMAYCREHFADPEFGEWYGYLRRDGLPTEPSTKGSTFKGPFHLPRALIMCDKMLEEILKA